MPQSCKHIHINAWIGNEEREDMGYGTGIEMENWEHGTEMEVIMRWQGGSDFNRIGMWL